jgi:hypothetical protein
MANFFKAMFMVTASFGVAYLFRGAFMAGLMLLLAAFCVVSGFQLAKNVKRWDDGFTVMIGLALVLLFLGVTITCGASFTLILALALAIVGGTWTGSLIRQEY